jgi:tetratricopeptide (TPR) repeat protein
LVSLAVHRIAALPSAEGGGRAAVPVLGLAATSLGIKVTPVVIGAKQGSASHPSGWQVGFGSRHAVTARDRIRQRQLERQAEGYLELGMPQQALEALGRLRNPSEFTPHALFLQGECLRSLARHQEALVPLSRAAQAEPENVHVWLAMGWCYKRIARVDLAIQSLQRAMETSPNDALIHYNLACYYSLAANKRRALTHLSQAFTLDPAYRTLVEAESDFDPLRSDPDFQALTRLVA